MCSGTPTLRRCAALRIIRRRGPPIHGRGPSAGRSGWLVSEPSPAAQDEDHFAAAAPRETLPGPGLAIAGDLETATRALDASSETSADPCVPSAAYHRPSSPAASPAARGYGRDGHLVEGGDLLPGQFFSRPGPAQQRVSVSHVPPWSQFPLVRFA